ncbi:hypothetical protein M758_4G014100 [Ceratodon purpureus]|nr:hypothetical protein M758_4G014100 [Ceratodon purpureus]
MLENKDTNNSPNASIDKETDENSEFVELDPIGRYGRYENILGKGAFKTVYRAFDEVDGIEVAWNQVKVEDVLQSPEDLERLYSEVHLLKTLKHKNIIKFYNSWVDTKTKNVNFITEIFTSGTLRQYRKRHKHVDIKAVKNWSRQILRGLLYLHSHDPPIIHRDLKCDNIFVNGNNGEVKIGDLGLAAILRQAHAAHSVIGTPEFMAPELYEEEYNELVDIYSFGMCLLEMVTFEYPYSECTNAAQIYKKVTAGKKPAALEKVKDPEVRAFIEKCLAIASRRLPARELLMDPFLQCEGDREALDTLPNLSHLKMGPINPKETCNEDRLSSNNKKELIEQKMMHSQENETKLQSDERPTTENNPSNETSKRIINGKNQSQEDDLQIHQHFSNDKYSKRERPRRSVDFRVKGKRRDDDTINLRLRIANLEGHIRNIHFPFDIEADTAMSVASEMVAELDLSDQDVTTIAEMIDAEILALVPEWNPGVAVDEFGGTEGEVGEEENFTSIPQEDPENLVTMSSDQGSINDQHNCNRKGRSHSPKVLALVSSPPRIEGTMMHGRFEEVTYHSRIEHSGSDIPPIFSSDSSEARDDERDLEEGHSTPKSTASVADSESPPHEDFDLDKESTHHEGNRIDSIAFNKLVELRRKAGTAKFSHDAWEGMTESSQRFEQSEHTHSHGEDLNEGSNQEVTQELELLALKQKQELEELQWRHEQALCALKNRHRYRTIQGDYELQRRSISPTEQHSTSSFEGFYQNHSLDPQSSPSHDRMVHSLDKNNKKLPLNVEDAQKLSRLSSLDSTCFNSNIRFVAAPKAFGLGHNLQGHILVEPYEERKSPVISSANLNNASKEIKHRNQIYESIVLNSSTKSPNQDHTHGLAPN